MSLAGIPECRTSGSFSDDEERLAWVQPREIWHGILFRHVGSFTLDGYSFDIAPFDFVVVPPGSRCEIRREGEGPYVYDYFCFVPVESERDEAAIPLLTHLGDEGKFWDVNFRRALSRLQFSRTSVHAVAYALLWAIAEPVQSLAGNVFVEEAEKLILADLSKPLRIHQLAQQLGISQSQLSRLFFAEHGRTPLQYIRDLRAEEAHRLLSKTAMPIKQVAAACGYPSPHAFNRFVRERLGASPREVRATRGQPDLYRVVNATRALVVQEDEPS